MQLLFFSEIAALLFIITQLIVVRRNGKHKSSGVQVFYWLTLVTLTVFFVRVMDGRISPDIHQLIMLIIICAFVCQQNIKRYR